jgi:hypothetical protein
MSFTAEAQGTQGKHKKDDRSEDRPCAEGWIPSVPSVPLW